MNSSMNGPPTPAKTVYSGVAPSTPIPQGQPFYHQDSGSTVGFGNTGARTPLGPRGIRSEEVTTLTLPPTPADGSGNSIVVFGFPPEIKGKVIAKLESFGELVGNRKAE